MGVVHGIHSDCRPKLAFSFSTSILCPILGLMLKWPREVVSFEFMHVNQTYGFLDEIQTKYGSESLWLSFNELFGWLPIAAVIDDAIFCVHGGLSPLLDDLEALSEMPLPIAAYEPDSMIADLMWSDPVGGFWDSRRARADRE
jgi:hypothetical protein